ncbi:SLC13 family permease [Thermogemmatispora sp.]|uniref:SLC13 family permease n=1 Tax=Thermogemmatispora sp. TaxID=1968838 RepID=UPI001DD2CD65|nr:SLC13 family permease [Thermogemmatispora sp.]MBX5448497.1 anion permease [Thermogemmatispora sp.]
MFLLVPLPALTRTLLTALIALLTLVGIMTRPFRWNEALIALAGAALLLLLGLISPLVALQTLLGDWNVFLFFLGMMALSAFADQAGLFDWLAIVAARLARQRARLLLLNVFLIGSLISMVLSNDATALILTPVVYTLVTRLRLPVIPYLFACTFIADTASFLLPVSNPINILVLSRFQLDLWTFLRLLWIPALAVIAINIGVFCWLYRREVRGSFDLKRLPSPEEAIKVPGYFRYCCLVLAAVAVAYVLASANGFPLSCVALAGALLLLAGALRWHQFRPRELAEHISWSLFGFIAGMFIIVQAVEETGLTRLFGELLLRLSGGSTLGAVLVGTLGAALGTNLINNVPMAVVLTASLQALHGQLAPTTQLAFVAATIFGCDLGPNLTTVGSLATVLWLLILRQRQLDISGLDYFKVGILVTPLMLLVGAVLIWLLL